MDNVSLSTQQDDPFSWSFVGAVIIISMALFGLVITTTYFCWLHDVIPAIRNKMLKITTKAENISVGLRQSRNQLSDNNICKAEEGSIVRPQSKQGKHTKDTRQREVNKRIHELKQGQPLTGISKNSPEKPEKSYLVRNYIKTSEAQSDDSDYQPSENLQNGIRDSGKEHEHAQQSGNHVQSGNEHRELSSDASSGTRKDACSLSHHSQKWSTINTKRRNRSASSSLHSAELLYKLGRSNRAVAPEVFNNDLRYKMCACVDKVIIRNRTLDADKKKDKNAMLIEVLQELRRSGNLGLNLLANPVARTLPTAATDHLTGETLNSSSSLNNDSSSNSVTLVTDSSNNRSRHNSAGMIKNLTVDDIASNCSLTIETDGNSSEVSRNQSMLGSSDSRPAETALNPATCNAGNPITPSQTLSEKTTAEPPIPKVCSIPNTDEPSTRMCSDLYSGEPSTIDPSQSVFGSAPLLEKEERLVRRIDSLFYSTTPSSVESMEAVFEAQTEHNKTNSPDDMTLDSPSALLSESPQLVGISKRGEINLPDLSEMSTDSLDNSTISVSSFNSTTLPSISPEKSEISSDNEYNTGKLRFFE